MECEQVREILLDAGDSDPPEEVRTDLEGHLARCRSCADEAAALRKEWDALKTLSQVKAPADFLRRVNERNDRPAGTERVGRWFSSFFGGKGLVEVAGLAVSAVLVVVVYQAVTRDLPRTKGPAVPATVEAPARVPSLQSGSGKGRAAPDPLQPSLARPAPAGSDRAPLEVEPAVLALALTIPVQEGERHVTKDARLRDGHLGEAPVKDHPATIRGAVERIRQLVEEADGRVATIEPSENTEAREATVVAEMPRESFPGFLGRLKQLGSIREVDEEAVHRQGGPTVRLSLRVTMPRG